MIAALLLAASVAQTPIDAERAFAADAQRIGQWTAFRKWATADATMFAPGPVKVQDYLKDRKDPPKAIDWWPTASWISCDGTLAVNTGGWKRPDGAVGYFTTVWQKQADGSWKWIVDGGDGLKVARERPTAAKVSTAACNNAPSEPGFEQAKGLKMAVGHSVDNTLVFAWAVDPLGGRSFSVLMWDGTHASEVLRDRIKPAARK